MDKKLLRLYQLEDGYCYNSDSLFLYDFATLFLKNNTQILDIGSGSGILGLLCARDYSIQLNAIEADPLQAFLSQKNAISNKLHANVICGDFLHTSFTQKFQTIISNPPFYREGILDSKNNRIKTARNAKFLPFELLCKKVKQILHPKGHFIFCYDAKESHHIFQTLQNHGFNTETSRLVYPKIDKKATLLLVQARINTKNSLNFLPPLITHIGEKQTDNSPEVKEIYKKCNTYSIKIHSTNIILEEKYASLLTL